eukprot:5057273-Alexandrium_andersonii.AAC.1
MTPAHVAQRELRKRLLGGTVRRRAPAAAPSHGRLALGRPPAAVLLWRLRARGHGRSPRRPHVLAPDEAAVRARGLR